MRSTTQLGTHQRILSAVLVVAFSGITNAQSATVLPEPGQPLKKGTPGGFEIIGKSLVSAQQLFLGTEKKVYFVDKVEDNPFQIDGHPAWASEWTLGSHEQRGMDAITNSFCAGGNVLGNGTWLNVGGNQAVIPGSDQMPVHSGSVGPHFIIDGRNSIRMLDHCDDGPCEWYLSPIQSEQRWYPTLETLADGSMIILGGAKDGGYVNNRELDNPTYQFFPPRGDGRSIPSPILQRTLPANLYPLTWLLPSGGLFIQSNWETVIMDIETGRERPLDNVPDAVRVYPASAGTVMLPLTPANNYTATILFCGGSDVSPDRWTAPDFHPPTFGASSSCKKITPDVSRSYQDEDSLLEPRVMVNLIALPDGKVLALNGARLGTAGYGNADWTVGNSYADRPVLRPAIYDPNAPLGTRWSNEGLLSSEVERMYHSSAILLPDGSVMVSGSNPNPDFTIIENGERGYPTEYRTELWYPSWYNERRPEPSGLLSHLSYGGPAFDVTLDYEDLKGNLENVKTAQVVIIRPGFSTHNINMGQRYLQLDATYTAYHDNNTAVLHVSQMPPNPAIFAPGPALIFVSVNGVPSVGKMIMIGSGQIGPQEVLPVAELVASQIINAGENGGKGGAGRDNGSASLGVSMVGAGVALGLVNAIWLLSVMI